jgi:two-component system, NarL family, nitrate/nitrite response regulator NarL
VRVLIVDDHPESREVVRELLENRGHVVVAEAADGKEAIAATARFNPDVVLLDLGLGGESGFDVARELTGTWPDLAVLLVSVGGDASPELVRACGARGLTRKERLYTADLAALCGAEGRPTV